MNLFRWPNTVARWLGYKPSEGSFIFDGLILVLGWFLLIAIAWFLLRKRR